MKKIALSFLAVFSLNSLANNMVGINYNDYLSVDGYGLSLSGNADSLVYDLDVKRLENGSAGVTFNFIHLGYAFGEISDGSFYAGLASIDANGGVDRETDLEVGYVVRDNGGVQWKLGLIAADDTFADFEVQIPAGDGNVELGALYDGDGDTWLEIGYSWNF
jgi:hypothetical protein|tara:strand:- start:154 stop:639 length:486 start_codon:yes stop_codon:yes gene_type:complete